MSESIYSKQGFGSELQLLPPFGLLVVDFVNGFVDPEQFGGGNIAAAVEATIPVLQAFRELKLPVAFSRIVFADDGSDANVFSRKVPSLLALTELNPSSAVVAQLAPVEGEFVVRKTEPSAFSGTGLSGWLRLRGVQTLVVVGATTSGCVRASVVDAMSAGFLPVVPENCVGDRAIAPHEANLFDMQQKYATVTSSSAVLEIVAALSQGTGEA
jgi:maleamate amidohydrolase